MHRHTVRRGGVIVHRFEGRRENCDVCRDKAVPRPGLLARFWAAVRRLL